MNLFFKSLFLLVVFFKDETMRIRKIEQIKEKNFGLGFLGIHFQAWFIRKAYENNKVQITIAFKKL